jgi:hypothetical protein
MLPLLLQQNNSRDDDNLPDFSCPLLQDKYSKIGRGKNVKYYLHLVINVPHPLAPSPNI